MKLIQENPYRTAGILSGATEREVQRQQSKIKKLARIGREADSELDFYFFSSIIRSEDNVEKAFSNLEQNTDKVFHSLFWFAKSNPFDETAINYLINGDKEKAIEIWRKVTEGKEISSKYFSCFNNLGTLKLLGTNKTDITEGISLKFKLIDSESFKDFVHFVADPTYTIDRKKLSEKLVNRILSEFQNKYTLNSTSLLFSGCNPTTRKFVTNKITQQPLSDLESLIEKVKGKRKDDPKESYNIGVKLMEQCKKDLPVLKSLLGASNLKYKLLSDNAASEILQCGIDYFNAWREISDPSAKSLKLLKYADTIATGSQVKGRIKDNIDGMNEWAQTATIQDEINYITQQIEAFQRKFDSTSNADSLRSNCKPKLNEIKRVLGASDELYLSISSAVVNNVLGMLITVVNEAQQGLEFDRSKLLSLPDTVARASEIINRMSSFDMNREARNRYNANRTAINKMNVELGALRAQMVSSFSGSGSSRPSGSNSGCYIATMAYGDYDHPQVLELRRFRDNVLAKSYLGRAFIKLYYRYSPILVEKLKNRKTTNKLIRALLDQLVKIVKQKP